jgi:hypothetical protein
MVTTVPAGLARVTVIFCCVLQNEYMKDDFFIKIETWHKPDLGTLENVSSDSAPEVYHHLVVSSGGT